MSLIKLLKQHGIGSTYLAFRQSQAYSNVAPGPNYNLFTVAGGPAELIALGGRCTVLAGGATTVTLNTDTGVGLDAGAFAVNGVLNCVIWSPLNVGGTGIGNVLGTTMTIATDPHGTIMSPGIIIATFAASTISIEWGLIYRKLSPTTRVYAT